MTPLGRLIAARIAATGPVSLSEYMADCLLHPQHGYYATRDPFGAGGDFITAPEISQMFGELLGLCLGQAWLDQGSPAFTLAELGPGRGTLMADVLRATRGVPGFHARAQVVLMEASPVLRARQQAALGGHPARWITDAADLPDAPLFLLANEFFDALPIRQFTRAPHGWCETMVGLSAVGLSAAGGAAGGRAESGPKAGGMAGAGVVRAGVVRAGVVRAGVVRAGVVRAGVVRAGVVRAGVVRAGIAGNGIAKDRLVAGEIAEDGMLRGVLTFGKSAPAPIAALDHRLADTAPGEVVEICPAATGIMARIGAVIADQGGAALILDYGGRTSRGDTFQALRGHAPVSALAEPGLADLTAHVDFDALARAAYPAAHAHTTQGALLQALGITARTTRLAERLQGAALENHLAATRRLTDPAEMGTLFKVLALYPARGPCPPGFGSP